MSMYDNLKITSGVYNYPAIGNGAVDITARDSKGSVVYFEVLQAKDFGRIQEIVGRLISDARSIEVVPHKINQEMFVFIAK